MNWVGGGVVGRVVHEKWTPGDVYRKSPPSANLAVDSTCKLPRRTSLVGALPGTIDYGESPSQPDSPPNDGFSSRVKNHSLFPRGPCKNGGRKHQHASAKAVVSRVSGHVTRTSDSHSRVDIARSIQAWAHLRYGIRIVYKRWTR